MTKKRLRQLYLYTIPALIGFVIWSGCQKDIPLTSTKGNEGVLNRSGCAAFVSFEVETTTLVNIVEASDTSQLSPIDRIMMLPHRERFAVEACYKDGGVKELVMTQQTPHQPIQYPANTADGYMKPDYTRLVMSEGAAKYYDQYNNLMRSEPYNPDAQVVQKIVDMIANRKTLTDAEFAQGLLIMRDSGLLMQEHPNSNLVAIRYNAPEGGYSIQVLDKTTRVAVGNTHYDVSGVLQSRSLLKVEGTAQNPVIKQALVESNITSMQGNIPMRIQQYAVFDNFTIIYN